LPVGSIEQHGHHLPVATDTILVDAVAHAGTERVGDELPVLVAPTVWMGYSPHHMDFGGTITVEHDQFVTLLRRITASALNNGFDAVLLLNGHGGNIPLVGTAVSVIGRDYPDVIATSLTYYQLAAPFVDDVRDSDVGGMAHGGEFETSLMLHLYPDLVDRDAMEGTLFEDSFDRRGQDLFDDGPLGVYRPFEAYSESGAIGEPSLATAEKGETLFRRLGDELGDVIADVHQEAISP
jgi:creatinine amidohydrolase